MIQSDPMKSWRDFFAPEWIWRHLMLLAFVGQIWLNSHYVMLDEYRLDQKNITSSLQQINSSLSDNRLSLRLIEQSIARLEDHERRLRGVEEKIHQLVKP